jgi:hypothetical protein
VGFQVLQSRLGSPAWNCLPDDAAPCIKFHVTKKLTSFLSALCLRTAPLSKSRANKCISLVESKNVCPMKAGLDFYCPAALAELPHL